MAMMALDAESHSYSLFGFPRGEKGGEEQEEEGSFEDPFGLEIPKKLPHTEASLENPEEPQGQPTAQKMMDAGGKEAMVYADC